MSLTQFNRDVADFDEWRTRLNKHINAYRMWLRRNQLFTRDIDRELRHIQQTISADRLTIAFAGEFSRGKTELINALFFSGYGQRILPSQAGRTTMCPTELFFERDSAPSLKLLPIETRLMDTSLQELRHQEGHWVEVELPINDADSLADSMHTITETKRVTKDEALALGFKQQMLVQCMEEPDKVEIPAWRHALINFPHPLLEQGLCILDTPGLNALGSEPELTLNLLPQAQAVVFVLAADTGVTATDLKIWQNYVMPLKQRPNLGLYAVLNKIDTLWDDLSDEARQAKAIARVVHTSAHQLDLDQQHIFTVSAQKGLLAQVRGDMPLLQRSQLAQLEKVLSETILGNKRMALWQKMLGNVYDMLQDSDRILSDRQTQLREQKRKLSSLSGDNRQQLQQLLEENRAAQEEFKRQSTRVMPSQRLMQRQAQILLDTIGRKRLEEHMQITWKELVKSRTTVGLFRSMRHFFDGMHGLMNEWVREAELSNKMAQSIYRKFGEELQLELMEPRLLAAKRFRNELQHLMDDADQFNRNLLFTFSEQSVAVRRFFNTTVNQIFQFYGQLRKEIRNWAQHVMNPLMQQLSSQRQLLEDNHRQLTSLQQNEATVAGRIRALDTLLLELDNELSRLRDSMTELEQAAPVETPSNIINLAEMRR